MQANKFKVTIGGKPTYVTAIDPDASESKAVPTTHHIVGIDRSGSMYYSIDELIDQAKSFVNMIRGSNDLLSVIWYSGVGSNGVIVEGATGASDVASKLEKYRSVVGSTCFSEPIKKMADIAREYAQHVDQTSITLFTDGCPVVPWSFQEELARSLYALSDLKFDINLSAVNSIGFGNYYRRDFLQTLSDVTEHGSFVHSNRMKDFSELFANSIDSSRGLRPLNLDVVSSNGDILYVGGDARSYKPVQMKLTRLNAEKNRIFVITEKNEPIFVNGETIEPTLITQKEDPNTVLDFFYAYADQLYYRGERQKALDVVVNSIGDKYVADAMMNAFTIDEVANAQKLLRDADLFSNGRYVEGRCTPGYLPKKDAFCLIDLFNIFFEDGNVSYVPFSDNVKSYERINRKAEDKFNVFQANQEEVVTPIKDFVWNKDLLNLSIQFSINGVVNLNPRSAKAVGLDPVFPTKIFRNHTIVKDGQLNVAQAEFLVSYAVLDRIKNQKVKYKVISVAENDLVRVVFDLKSIPIINRTYIDQSTNLEEVAGITVEIAHEEAALKVLNNIRDKTVEANGSLQKTDAFKTYTVDQIAVLQEHGISKQGWYNGVQVERAKAEDSDSYEARTLNFYVKGASSLPSIADFEKMVVGKKTVNVPGQMMINAYNQLEVDARNEGLNLEKPSTKLVSFLERKIKGTKDVLQSLRNEINVIKLAKVLTNDFFHGLVPNDKGDYTTEYGSHTIVLRNDTKTVYI